MNAQSLIRTLMLGAALMISSGYAAAEPGGNHERHEKQEHQKKDHGERRGQRAESGDRGEKERREERREAVRERIRQQLFKDIDLSDEQQAEIRTIGEEARKQRRNWMREHGDELRQIHRAMRQAHESGDKEAGKAAREKLMALMKDVPKPADAAEKVRGVLTAEQTEQFNKNLEELRKRWHGRHDKDGKGQKDRKNQKDHKDEDQNEDETPRQRSR